MANPQEYHRLLTTSARNGDQQTFLTVAPQYFATLGEQIIQNLLYEIQQYNALLKRVWLIGFTFVLATIAVTAIIQQHKPIYITTHLPQVISPYATLISFAGSIIIISIPVGIIGIIKTWLYHLVRKTESTMHKRAKAFAGEAWKVSSNKGDPIPYIEAEAYRRYSAILKNLSKLRH